jgi:hypothetical protein
MSCLLAWLIAILPSEFLVGGIFDRLAAAHKASCIRAETDTKSVAVYAIVCPVSMGVVMAYRNRRGAVLAASLWACAELVPSAHAQTEIRPADQTVYLVRPSEADAAVTQFDEPNVVAFRKDTSAGAQLAVFLPGTGGKPENVRLLLSVIAAQGYRAIGLEYDDEPAVVQTCPRDPNPACSADFRQERIFGDGDGSPVSNLPQETIVRRLVALLRYLDRQHPGEHWSRYLAGDEPGWSRIVISGLSQGAGMAAYIAKRKAVARVVLFSSPWDFIAPSRDLAPWISEPSITPPERWFAEYHRRENTAALIAQSYRLLRIPEANVQIFDLDLPDGMSRGGNPFHGSTVRLQGYIPQWQTLYGRSP